MRGGDHAGRAEAALQGMVLAKGFLQRREIPMPALPSAKQRRRRAGEVMRGILQDMLVATRPQRTLFEAFLDARRTFGSRYKLVEDVRKHLTFRPVGHLVGVDTPGRRNDDELAGDALGGQPGVA